MRLRSIYNPANVSSRIVETDVSLMCSSMPAFASLSKDHFSSLSYLSSLRNRLLSSFHLSDRSDSFKTRSTQDSKNNPSTKNGVYSYDTDRSQIYGHDYLELKEGSASRRGPVTNIQGSLGDADVEHGDIMKSVSLQQLVTKAT